MKTNRVLHVLLTSAILLSSLTWTAVLTIAGKSAGPRCYVNDDAGGANTGADWMDAYANLQSALVEPACTEIWVAAGIYKPGPSGDQSATFTLKSGVAVYGGFAGNETVLEDRDWTANPTILSGDLDGSGDHTDNDAYHVVTDNDTDATVVLDGFTVSGGNARASDYPDDSYDPNSDGGGMYSWKGSPSLSNLIFSNNYADGAGGGLYNSGIDYNRGDDKVTYPSLVNVTFSSNHAAFGGGMYTSFSQPSLVNITFSSNTAGVFGGGMVGGGNLTNVIFSSNTAQVGGGMDGSGRLTNVVFFDNSADAGGGMRIWGNSTLINVTFSNNTAEEYGGGIYNQLGDSSLANSILWENTADIRPQIYNDISTTLSIAHSDIQGAFAGGVWDKDQGTNLGGNRDIDPHFVNAAAGDLRLGNDSLAINAGDNARLPADTYDLDGDGNKAETVPYDLDGNPRILGGIVDLGAYEAEPTPEASVFLLPLFVNTPFTPAAGPRCYVDADARGANSGDSWANAYRKLQWALQQSACTEVWVAAGMYKPGPSGARTATYRIMSGVSLYGGFAGNEIELDDRDWEANPTILSGDLDGSGSLNDNDAYHVVTARALYTTIVLDGFTISGGNANGADDDRYGGGMDGSGSLTNVIFDSNTAVGGGGGLYGGGSLTNVTFSNNTSLGDGGGKSGGGILVNVTFGRNWAGGSGGGMYGAGGGTLTNVTFSSNTAGQYGGGLVGGDTLTNVTFRGNTAGVSGGGMFGSANLTNVAFFNNSAAYRGGGIISGYGDRKMINVTLSHNTAQSGGGIFNEFENKSLTNSIVWGNTADSGPQIYGSPLSIAYSDIQGAFAGGTWDASLGTNAGGNRDIDPHFVNAAAGDLRLQDGSPAINAGDHTRLPADTYDLDGDGDTAEPVPYDLDNDPRVKGGVVDMGAYETR